MAGATEGLDLNQALDVQSDVTTQVALDDDVSLIDVVTDLKTAARIAAAENAAQ